MTVRTAEGGGGSGRRDVDGAGRASVVGRGSQIGVGKTVGAGSRRPGTLEANAEDVANTAAHPEELLNVRGF